MNTTFRQSGGAQISPKYTITDLEFNDVVLFDNYDEIQIMNNASTNATRIELRASASKTKAFSLYLQKAHKTPIFNNSLPTEEMPNFKYLGTTLIPNG